MGGFVDLLGRHPLHLLQLLHQVVLGLQAAGSVHQEQIRLAALLAGPNGVEEHRGRVRARGLGDDVHAGPLGPDAQLIDGRGPEGVPGAEDHLAPPLLVAVGQLAQGGGLARAVHPHHEDHGQDPGLVDVQGLRGLQHAHHLLLQDQVGVLGGLDALPAHPLLGPLHQLHGGLHAHVPQDEQLLQLLPELVGDLVGLEEGADASEKPRASLLEALFQPHLVLGFLFFPAK